jgi:hypothetical protein
MEITQKEIQVLEKQVSPLVAEAGSYKIDSVESVDTASLFLKKVRDAENNLEAKRLEFTSPLNQSLRAINDTFTQLKAPLTQARVIITNRILLWKQQETERLAKEEARRRAIQEAHLKAGHEINAPVVLERPENKIGNTQTRKVWKWKLIDQTKVPDVYKVVNQVMVNESIRQGTREIPGLEIYQEEQLSIVGR